jgi:hypothetical protein
MTTEFATPGPVGNVLQRDHRLVRRETPKASVGVCPKCAGSNVSIEDFVRDDITTGSTRVPAKN